MLYHLPITNSQTKFEDGWITMSYFEGNNSNAKGRFPIGDIVYPAKIGYIVLYKYVDVENNFHTVKNYRKPQVGLKFP